ncbi:MAG: DinB family protein [Chryseolinea sp.]
MQPMPWFERKFTFGFAPSMLPFMTERLEGTIIRIKQKVDNIDDELSSYHFENKWSIKQNIGHLMDVDEISERRVDEIMEGAKILSRADIQTQADYNSMPMRNIVENFSAKRRNNIRRLLELSEAQLRMTSIHPRLMVPMNAVDLAWFDAEHDDHHLVRINQIMEAAKANISI